MDGEPVVYSKQEGESPVPVTVRIEWHTDGTIRPQMYWMPDNSCYQVVHIYECTPLAFLKRKGEGLCYRVRAVLTETDEPYSELRFSQRETYLYFADNFFCGRNIIDHRYEHACKKYVPVVMDVFPYAGYELIYFWVQDSRYMVEKTLEVDARGSFNAGGVGIWHKVEVRLINADNDEDVDHIRSVRRQAALYFELNKWFVSVTKTS